MTDFLKFKNFGGGVLDEAIDDSQTSIVLGSGQGATFPDDSFVVLIHNANPDTESELVHVSGRTGDTLTGCTRGYESTTPRSFEAGSFVENVITEAALDQFRVAYNGLIEPEFPWIWTADNAETEPMFQLRQDGSGDAALRFRLGASTADWTLGIDNSDSDKFKISASTALGTTDRLTLTTGGFLGLGGSIPGTYLHVNGGGTYPHTPGADSMAVFSRHTNTTDGAVVQVVGGTSGYAGITFGDTGNVAVGRINYTHSTDSMVFRTGGTDRVTIDSSGNVDIDNSLNVDGTGVIDQGLTVGDASNTLRHTCSGSQLEPQGTGGSQTWNYTPSSDYWTPADTTARVIACTAPINTPGTVLEAVRFHVYDEDPGSNSWSFYVYRATHSLTLGSSFTALQSQVGVNISSAGTRKGLTDHYYIELSGGSLPRTIADYETLLGYIVADAGSDATEMRVYAVEFLYRARKF